MQKHSNKFLRAINRFLYFGSAALMVTSMALGLAFQPVQAHYGSTNTPTTTTGYGQLQISDIQCYNGQVGIQFILNNVPTGWTPDSTITFTLSVNGGSPTTQTATFSSHTGSAYHYFYYGNVNGTYDVISAYTFVRWYSYSHEVDLHNPDAYSSVNQNCLVSPTSTIVPPTATFTSVPPTATSTTPPTATNTVVPPTPTDTSVPPTPTNTGVPPTVTSTSVPPTSTNTPVSGTATPTPEGTTETPVSTQTTPHGPGLAPLVFIDPYCTVNGGSLQWTVENPNSSNITVLYWTLDGGPHQAGFTAAPGSNPFTTTTPGTHTISLVYGESQQISDTSTISVCALPIPNTGTNILIPVTGADQTGALSQGLFFGGLSLAGLGLFLSALRKFLNL